LDKIKNAMNTLRNNKGSDFNTINILSVRDYKNSEILDLSNNKKSKIDLPKSDVLYYEMIDSWFCIRPSGTEPKIKLYYGVKETNYDKTHAKLVNLKKEVLSIIEPLLKF